MATMPNLKNSSDLPTLPVLSSTPSPETLLQDSFPQLEAMVQQGKRRELNAGGLAILALALSGAMDTAEACEETIRQIYLTRLHGLLAEIDGVKGIA